MPVKYTSDDILNITTFENMTKSRVIDYASEDGTLYFVIKTNNFRDIIGRNGSNIKELSKKMRKNLIVYRHSENIEEFTKNLINVPLKKIEIKDRSITIDTEKRNKGLLIGRGGKNINIIKTFLKRQFNIDSIKIE